MTLAEDSPLQTPPVPELSLLDTVGPAALLSFMNDLSPFAGHNVDERVLCTLYDPLALLHLVTKNITCERPAFAPQT